MRTKLFTIISALGLFLIVGTTSCKKNHSPKAIVTVTKADGTAIEGAAVTIYSNPSHTNDYGETGYVDPEGGVRTYTASTDANGQASFEFKHESIYDVSAWYLPANSSDTLKGTGVLILENDKTYEKTLIIR